MLAMRISNANVRLAENQDEFHAIDARFEIIEGIPTFTTLWEPTPRELKELINGGAVVLNIQSTQFPPVYITTQPAPEE